MALYTPEYKPNGNEVAVIVTDEGTIRVRCTARTPHPRRQSSSSPRRAS